jgi:hypothetical protein
MYFAYFPQHASMMRPGTRRGHVSLGRRGGNPHLCLTHLEGRLGDRCHLEVAPRLRQDAAVQGGKSHERNGGLGQNDALHVRTCHYLDIARDLPEDVLCKCPVRQVHNRVCGLQQVPRHLNDEDVGIALAYALACAFEVDGSGDVDVRFEGVDAGRQFIGCATEDAAEGAASEIDPRGIGVESLGGISVGGLHGADRGGQSRRNGWSVGCRVGLARDLRGRRKLLSIRAQGEAEASHGFRGDGRDRDVACDDGGGHGGDAGLGEDHVFTGSQEFDRGFFGQLALSTSDGLGIYRKREQGEENEVESIGREHHGLESFRVKLI